MADLGGSRFRLNGLLLLVICGLAIFAWWFSAQKQSGPERLFMGDYESINLLTVDRPERSAGAKKILFEKKEKHWLMVAPYLHKADPMRIRQLLTFLSEPVAATYDSAGRDLAQYGLQSTRLILRFNEQQFILGKLNTVSGNRYVLHENKIKLVSEAVYGLAIGDWESFVLPEALVGD
uniref:DUF4340 domain-containing protein n=1 Tax=uncultured Thiotrichaceae bacterium TaxID=298394 RepID=A0A6S6UI51_9GAMM|nr:MAG: Unknown protein [uncultured Thiotrichaceae bacterium]